MSSRRPSRSARALMLAHRPHTHPNCHASTRRLPASLRVTPSCHVGGGGLGITGRRAPQNPCLGKLEQTRRIRRSKCRLASGRKRHFNSGAAPHTSLPVVTPAGQSAAPSRPGDSLPEIAHGCWAVAGSSVAASGVLSSDVRFGPPGYGETPERDAQITIYHINLDEPQVICPGPDGEIIKVDVFN